MLGMLGSLHAAAWAEGAEPPEQAYVHTLGVAGLLLEQLTSVRPALAARSDFTLQELLDTVIVRGLRNRSAKVRSVAQVVLDWTALVGRCDHSAEMGERRLAAASSRPHRCWPSCLWCRCAATLRAAWGCAACWMASPRQLGT